MERAFQYISKDEASVYLEKNGEDPRHEEEIMLHGKENGGLMYEFGIRWYDFSQDWEDDQITAMQVEVFDDAFRAYDDFKDLFEFLTNHHDEEVILPDQMAGLLKEKFGMTDETDYHESVNVSW